jgi:hypothetical protein
MLIYDDIYTWEGPDFNDRAIWLLSCHLWMIDLSLSNPNVLHLRPKIVVASDVNEGPKRKICAETLGKQIYKEFDLDIKRTLWVEYDPSIPTKMAAALMKPQYHDGREIIYSIQWRKLMTSEKEIIRRFIPRLDV